MGAEAAVPEAVQAAERVGVLGFLFEPWTASGRSLAEILRRKAIRKPAKGVAAQVGEENEKKAMHPVLEKLAFLNWLSKAAAMEKLAPPVSEKQRKFMGAELRRLREGKKTRTGMSEEQLREYAAKPEGKKLPERAKKESSDRGCPVCGGAAVVMCRCFVGDSKCASGHEWHYQDGKPVVGPSPHASTAPPIEKQALVGALAKGILGGALAAGKAVGKAALKPAKWMLFPTSKLQGAAGTGLWAGTAGLSAGVGHKPYSTRTASLADRLLGMTKEASKAPALRRGASAPATLKNPAAPETRQKSGPAAMEATPSVGVSGGGHVQRPAI